MQIGLSNAWKIWSADISTAFLQGEPLDKPVYCSIPKEANPKPDELLEVYVCVYGLGDGPKCWNAKFSKDQLKLGAK